MSKAIIRAGDPSSHGGTVEDGFLHFNMFSNAKGIASATASAWSYGYQHGGSQKMEAKFKRRIELDRRLVKKNDYPKR